MLDFSLSPTGFQLIELGDATKNQHINSVGDIWINPTTKDVHVLLVR
jgi:hypothetical protein